MMKLFLLGGFRGIVANLLWTRAEENKRDHDWDRLKTNVDLITKLQPHFLSIWTFQGWNLAYNVSVEWDAPEDKYEWIKQGIKFVQDGVDKNRRSPDLIWDTAWFYYHKLGFSDESIILRRLFRDDEDEDFKTLLRSRDRAARGRQRQFQARLWLVQPRPWPWSIRATSRLNSGTSADVRIDYVDPTPQRKGRPDDIAFRSMPAHAQTRYAAALEKMSIYGIPATFGEVAKNEWVEGSATNGSSSASTSSCRTTRSRATASSQRDPDQARRCVRSRTLQQTHREPEVLDRPLGRPDELPLLEGPLPGREDAEGAQARQLFYEGTQAYKKGEFPQAADKFKEGLDIWKTVVKEYPGLSVTTI